MLDDAGLKGMIMMGMTAAGALGKEAQKIAQVVAVSFVKFLKSNVTVKTVDVGSAGPVGKGTGVVIAAPPLYGSLCAMGMAQNGLQGVYSIPIATAIGLACGTHILTAQVQSTHQPVALGMGTGQFMGATDSALFGIMTMEAKKAGLLGKSNESFFRAIASGLAKAVSSSAATVVISGAPTTPPSPATGSGDGSLV